MMNLTVANEERYVLWMDWKVKKLGRSYKVMSVKLASVSEQCELCNEESRHLCYTEDDGHICIECLNDFYVAEELGYDSASDSEPEETAPAYTKVFEYVRSNELGVVFKQKGVLVKIGWNPSDARPYIKVDGKPMKAMMIQSAIDSFKPFSNGVHGDIARIVKALVRVRKMPASVRVKQEERKRQSMTHTKPKQENVSPAERKENTLVTRYSGTVDASWLVEFRELFVSNNERQPTGYEIRDAWLRCGA